MLLDIRLEDFFVRMVRMLQGVEDVSLERRVAWIGLQETKRLMNLLEESGIPG